MMFDKIMMTSKLTWHVHMLHFRRYHCMKIPLKRQLSWVMN